MKIQAIEITNYKAFLLPTGSMRWQEFTLYALKDFFQLSSPASFCRSALLNPRTTRS